MVVEAASRSNDRSGGKDGVPVPMPVACSGKLDKLVTK